MTAKREYAVDWHILLPETGRFPQKPAVIYGLIDPVTDKIRYIGKTDRSLMTRITNHMNEKANCHRCHWLQKLKSQGLEPEVCIFEIIEGAGSWQEAERYWIAKGRQEGWPLTNNTSGGDGVSDLPPETRAKMRLTWLGRKHKPETIEKLKIARAKRVSTPESRQKQSVAMKGRKILWLDKIAEANRKIAPEQAAEIKRRLAAGELVKDLAVEYGVNRMTISKVKMGTYFKLRQRAADAAQ